MTPLPTHILDSLSAPSLASIFFHQSLWTAVGVPLVVSLRPQGEGRQDPELDHETQG